MCDKEKTDKIDLYEYQFMSITSRTPRKKELEKFKFPKNYSYLPEASNNNCSHLNNFLGCSKNLSCSCIILISIYKNIDSDLLSDLLSKLKLQLIDSRPITF